MKRQDWSRRLRIAGISGVIGLAVIALAVIALQPRAVTVEVAAVRRGPLEVAISAEGRTRIHDRFVIAAPVTGKLARIELHRGDMVGAGSTVSLIESLPLEPLDPRQRGGGEARLLAAEAARREAEALVEKERAAGGQALRDRQRAERLVESGDLPRQEFERLASVEAVGRQQLVAALSRAQMAVAEVDAARAALRSLPARGVNGGAAASRTETIPVRSPVTGRVLKLYEESERVVTAGTPLIEVSNPATLELVIEVLSTDAVTIRPGTRMSIDRWGGDHPLSATVRLIEPAAFTRVSALGVEEQRVNIIADLHERPETLGDGYRIEARIIVWENPEVLLVPVSALFRQDEDWAVYVAAGSRAILRKVRIEHRGDKDAELLEGLAAGDRVIIHPAVELSNGTRIATKP